MSQALYTELSGKLNKAIAGKDILLSIWDQTGSVLLAIAGQQGLTINRDKDTIEVTSKDANGWKEFVVGLKEWSIDNDGVYVRDHASHKQLKKLFESDDPFLIKVTNQKTETDMFGGLALLTSYPIEAPYDDAVTYTISLQGTGELVDLEDEPQTPETPEV
ncbi:phage major tail protein, TP901-1 family [Niallia circulans]|uniref:phage major tail protein, TP901-1 family n=1 Tax=Niallia circulans TaxID=1397 RepID=UPI000BA651B0|nr:phage major tail protein, TP901-1 family [Niallia circulans]PAD86671.1 phage major tail protein, TP901-1 family [Niallia circulans]